MYIGGVGDMNQQVGLARFFERAPECLHEPVRQIADKADSVGQEQGLTLREEEPPCGGIERREQCILRVHARRGEGFRG